jgi:hypothetical protein
LFGYSPPRLRVRLDRPTDRDRPCCSNIAVVGAGKGQHAASLRCTNCGAHRGWLRRETLNFLTSLSQRFGAPAEPITLRDNSIGDLKMAEKAFDNTNRGALFRNTEKKEGDDRDRDYSGTLNVNGTEFWVSGWLQTSAKGTKYLSLAIKQKDDVKPKDSTKQTAKHEFNDEMPF